MAAYSAIVVILIAASAASSQAAPLHRKMLQDMPQLGATEIQSSQEYQRYSAGGDAILQNEVQGATGRGATESKVFAVAETKKVTQVDSETRGTLNSLYAHGSVQQAAGTGAPYKAAKEAASYASITMYGHGMALDAANRGAIASTDAQRGIQANLDNPAAAAASGYNAANQASYPMSHEWTN